MDREQATREFVQQLTNCQPRLYAYITALVFNPHEADDVLQQTNLVLWEKLDEYLGCQNFEALACRVAYFQVLALRRDRGRLRDRLFFGDELLERIASAAGDKTSSFQSYLAAMRDCMMKLTETQRQMVERRYGPGGSVSAIAEESGDTPNSVSASLYRIRKQLLACIRENMAKDRDV